TPATSAFVVERLIAAGAIPLGKTNLDQFATGLVGTRSPYGATANAFDRRYISGGSSSGSAVAVALGQASFALGTDTAGSCRAPAAFCGVFGFRPSHGAVSSNGVVPLAATLDTIGWFARDIDTLAAVGDILLPHDLHREPLASVVCLQEAFADCEAEFLTAAQPALGVLREHFSYREATLGQDFWSEALAHFRNLQAFEAWRAHREWIRAVRPDFGPGIKERFEFASTVSVEAKQNADAFRREARAKIDELFQSSALIVVPTTPFAAPLLSASAEELDRKRYQMIRTFLLASFFGLPQISIPLAKAPGAPLAISLIGPRWSDRTLLDAARRLAL
ncbi:MAG: amidase, partial [Methylocystis sp.]|nr:amidase [Methylocystis sp.]